MLGFSLDTARDASLWTVAGAVILALAAVWLVKQVVTKILTVAVLLALAGLVWSQREELTDCADKVQDQIAAGMNADTKCTFFSREVTIPGRDTLFNPDDSTPADPAATTTTTTTPT